VKDVQAPIATTVHSARCVRRRMPHAQHNVHTTRNKRECNVHFICDFVCAR